MCHVGVQRPHELLERLQPPRVLRRLDVLQAQVRAVCLGACKAALAHVRECRFARTEAHRAHLGLEDIQPAQNAWRLQALKEFMRPLDPDVAHRVLASLSREFDDVGLDASSVSGGGAATEVRPCCECATAASLPMLASMCPPSLAVALRPRCAPVPCGSNNGFRICGPVRSPVVLLCRALITEHQVSTQNA